MALGSVNFNLWHLRRASGSSRNDLSVAGVGDFGVRGSIADVGGLGFGVSLADVCTIEAETSLVHAANTVQRGADDR